MSASYIYESAPPNVCPNFSEISNGLLNKNRVIVSKSMCIHGYPGLSCAVHQGAEDAEMKSDDAEKKSDEIERPKFNFSEKFNMTKKSFQAKRK